MEKKKIPYESPRTELTQVELENPICSGSADITGQTNGSTIKDQEVDNDFGSANDFSSGTEWEKASN